MKLYQYEIIDFDYYKYLNLATGLIDQDAVREGLEKAINAHPTNRLVSIVPAQYGWWLIFETTPDWLTTAGDMEIE